MFWFFSNYFYNYGLSATSVASSSVLSNTTTIFVYLIGVIFMRDQIQLIKGIFVLISFGGVVLITLQDYNSDSNSDSAPHSFLGDMVSLLGAFCYGVYSTYLKFKVPKEKEETF